MTTLKISEAKAHLGHYVRRAKMGESFILADRNRPLASLVPLDTNPIQGVQPRFALMDGSVAIPDDFNDPLTSFEESLYGS
jgi:prevent-host-death family protein